MSTEEFVFYTACAECAIFAEDQNTDQLGYFRTDWDREACEREIAGYTHIWQEVYVEDDGYVSGITDFSREACGLCGTHLAGERRDVTAVV